MSAAERYGADGVLAPVVPQVPSSAPDWIRRGRFYEFARQPEGASVPYNFMRFGNVLLRAAPLLAEEVPFDPSYGLTAGEDTDLLIRLSRKGAKIVWSERPAIFESRAEAPIAEVSFAAGVQRSAGIRPLRFGRRI